MPPGRKSESELRTRGSTEIIMENKMKEDHSEQFENEFEYSKNQKKVCGGFISESTYRESGNLSLLLFLYTLQGIPIGLALGSIPFILQKSVSYTEMGIFTLVSYPYSLKLLWAPIVDTFHFQSVGRRLSWIIPVQILLGLVFLYLSLTLEITLERDPINIWNVTFLFLILILLAATQDIAVDGWALTLLSKETSSLASPCQGIGLDIGYFASYTVFLALSSAEFCNSYLRFTPSPQPIITLSDYLLFSSALYLLFTLFLILFKRENLQLNYQTESELSLKNVYEQTFKLALKPQIKQLAIVLLLCRVGFAAADNITDLELLSRGFKKEYLALFALFSFPLQLINNIFLAKTFLSKGPLAGWFFGYKIKLVVACFTNILIYIYPKNGMESWYFILVLMNYLITSSGTTVMFASMGGFFNKISDRSIGGTYVTLLNTVSNIGTVWCKFPVLFLADKTTISHCRTPEGLIFPDVDCVSRDGDSLCQSLHGGRCTNQVEGYYVVNILCAITGIVLYWYLKKKLNSVQQVEMSEWQLGEIESGQKKVLAL